jgi:hypothetical protein
MLSLSSSESTPFIIIIFLNDTALPEELKTGIPEIICNAFCFYYSFFQYKPDEMKERNSTKRQYFIMNAKNEPTT